ncbi:MAG: EF-P lysine aminoacylase GenX [Deltaproteobacteria bacterium]|nr:EF-P lysine aminoacylase GenX [Deltaproteobacteria bacterium]
MDKRRVRSEIIRAIRGYFESQDFLETDTPSLVLSPGMEPHIRPLELQAPGTAERVFLPTSPEFAMKGLLAQGYERIFQICKAYRREPMSNTHNPEFTMLEWYRANSGYEAIMDDVENLFAEIGKRVGCPANVTRPWPRFTIEECFKKFASLELSALLEVEPLRKVCIERGWIGREAPPMEWDDLFFLVMMNAVEPALEKLGRPAIVYLYPASQAALSNMVTDSRGLTWAKRFEVYAGGFELGNAFDELVDAREQRRRFEKDMALRAKLYGADFPANPIDEDFLKALETMPPSGGIAMGVDRIVMYFTGAADIKQVLWAPSYWPQQQKR